MGQTSVTEESLKAHSFDLVHFPMYLEQNVAATVRVEMVDTSVDANLVGYFISDDNERSSQYIKLVSDADGVSTKTDQFFYVVHSVFQQASTVDVNYIGFTRCGSPVYAPLFALASLYKRYRRGIYEPGQTLPTPCPFLSASYEGRL